MNLESIEKFPARMKNIHAKKRLVPFSAHLTQ